MANNHLALGFVNPATKVEGYSPGEVKGKSIAASSFKAVGYGSEKPVADNTTDEGRENNRRVELSRVD